MNLLLKENVDADHVGLHTVQVPMAAMAIMLVTAETVVHQAVMVAVVKAYIEKPHSPAI